MNDPVSHVAPLRARGFWSGNTKPTAGPASSEIVAVARDGGKVAGREMRAVLGESEYDFRRSYIERAFDVVLPSADIEPRLFNAR
jgi:hypothetical protein